MPKPAEFGAVGTDSAGGSRFSVLDSSGRPGWIVATRTTKQTDKKMPIDENFSFMLTHAKLRVIITVFLTFVFSFCRPLPLYAAIQPN
ncbi:hypothetical protein [Leptolyngbya sp. 7M]|uniref:hypothetical protein n=1 Tax=Leptolyngbya sp. 7M TaxID=2812896 RepID=UPI001B8C6D1D|nr:hypothetical protein [Leptolyngbya sp. 7M]QYO63612.1 hypothetical protein JVX88_27630 [Leptolyngbya sp. 7M]